MTSYADNCPLSTEVLVLWAKSLKRFIDQKEAKKLAEERLIAAFGDDVQMEDIEFGFTGTDETAPALPVGKIKPCIPR